MDSNPARIRLVHRLRRVRVRNPILCDFFVSTVAVGPLWLLYRLFGSIPDTLFGRRR